MVSLARYQLNLFIPLNNILLISNKNLFEIDKTGLKLFSEHIFFPEVIFKNLSRWFIALQCILKIIKNLFFIC